MNTVSIHPSVDNGIKKGDSGFTGGTLVCRCARDPVIVGDRYADRVQPRVRLHQMLETTRRDVLRRRRVCRATRSHQANANRLKIVDSVRRRSSVRRAGAAGFTCMAASRTRSHPFYGFDFVHAELSTENGWAAPDLAAFVSSVIETAVRDRRDGRRARAAEGAGLPPYDSLDPPLMDAITTRLAKRNGVLMTTSLHINGTTAVRHPPRTAAPARPTGMPHEKQKRMPASAACRTLDARPRG